MEQIIRVVCFTFTRHQIPSTPEISRLVSRFTARLFLTYAATPPPVPMSGQGSMIAVKGEKRRMSNKECQCFERRQSKTARQVGSEM